jgi:hypothetical protein
MHGAAATKRMTSLVTIKVYTRNYTQAVLFAGSVILLKVCPGHLLVSVAEGSIL